MEIAEFIQRFAAELVKQSDRIWREEDANDAAISGALDRVVRALETVAEGLEKPYAGR